MQLAVGAALAAENLVVGDRDGPHRLDHLRRRAAARRLRGDVPTSWADGTHRWDGYLGYDEHPRVVDPPDGRLWTANARVVGGEMLRQDRRRRLQRRHPRLDDSRRTCSASTRPTSARSSTSQLDNRSLFLDRWRTRVPRRAHRRGRRGLAAARRRPAARGRRRGPAAPSADSVAYRIVRTFRLTASRMAFDAHHRRASTAAAPTPSTWATVRRIEGPLWRLVHERPAHLLDPAYPDLGRVPARRHRPHARRADRRRPAARRDRTWGEPNAADIAHPLAAAVPLARPLPDMPRDPLPGDIYVPRVLTPRSGASRTLRRLARPRSHRHPAHAGRTERPSAVAALRRSAARVDRRHAGAAAAGRRRAHLDADSVAEIPSDRRMKSVASPHLVVVCRDDQTHRKPRLFRRSAARRK